MTDGRGKVEGERGEEGGRRTNGERSGWEERREETEEGNRPWVE